ncbi:hypothetical protein HCC60_07735 [Streptococcus suis]|nr:hypothetical protein [Streptococcus suis]
MNQIKKHQVNEVSLADLRQLGRQGGVTARLEDGSIVTLRPKFGTKKEKGYIAGKLEDVELVINYPKLYPQIRTIKSSNGILVARKQQVGQQTKLVLTGKGYKKPSNPYDK